LLKLVCCFFNFKENQDSLPRKSPWKSLRTLLVRSHQQDFPPDVPYRTSSLICYLAMLPFHVTVPWKGEKKKPDEKVKKKEERARKTVEAPEEQLRRWKRPLQKQKKFKQKQNKIN
jgi:hypothetical protein